MKILLQYGAEVNTKDGTNRATPLHCAASKGHLSSLKMLIRHGADVNAGLNNKSPLHYAVQSAAVDCVKELLDNNAIPNTPQVSKIKCKTIACRMNGKNLSTYNKANQLRLLWARLRPSWQKQ
jgi:ankyrin repeat protein